MPSGTNIGQGVNYTVDQPIRLAFDRFLNPESVIRQSVLLEDSSGNLVTNPLIAYDPVTLTVTLSNPNPPNAWLTVDQEYRVVLIAPSADAGPMTGLLAIDGAPLAPTQPILFTAGKAANPPAPGVPVMHFCDDVFPVFQKCQACHNAAYTMPAGFDAGYVPLGPDGGLSLPYEGLVLGCQFGQTCNSASLLNTIKATAIGQVANESNTGPAALPQTYPTSTPFGIDMQIINPGEPGNSWLMYKVLLATPWTGTADGFSCSATSSYGSGLADPLPCASATDPNCERVRLSNYILGNLMPYPPPPRDSGPDIYETPLTMAELERLSLWIAQGAVFDQPSCTSCQ